MGIEHGPTHAAQITEDIVLEWDDKSLMVPRFVTDSTNGRIPKLNAKVQPYNKTLWH